MRGFAEDKNDWADATWREHDNFLIVVEQMSCIGDARQTDKGKNRAN